jgi:guanine deaminase
MSGFNLSPLQMFYLLTLGAAESLSLDSWIGNFEPGKEADFVVIDWNATELMRRRMSFTESLEERLFALIILGDDRNIAATHVMGKPVYRKEI